MAERIEEFKAVHLDECAQLAVATFNAEPWNDDWTFDMAKRELAWTMGVPGFAGLVSLDEEGAVAFATGYREPDDRREVYFLKTLCVGPESQGSGIGSRLLGHLKEYLAKSGVNTIYLITRKGIPAERFYGKHGYKINDEDIVMTHEW
jgi:aminoglycoside 6'-N-acetyltransferase I